MALLKPYQVLAQERAEELDRERARASVMATAGQAMMRATENIAPPAKTIHPRRDWEASDRLAAQRAMGLEARQQQHGYQMEELDKRAELGREEDLWKIRLRQRFAPKGAGPVATLLKEYVRLATDKEPGETTEARKGRLQMIHNQLGRLGSGGKRVAEDISTAGFGPDRYAVKPKSEREAAEAATKEGALDRRAEAANKARLESARIGSLRGGGIPVELRAAQATMQANKARDQFSDTPDMKAKRSQAQATIDKYMAGGGAALPPGAKMIGGKMYAPAADGGWEELDDEE